jgi:hypothetical protein
VLTENGEIHRVTLVEGTPEPEIDLEVGLPVQIGPVTRMKNVFTGSSWLVTQDNTRSVRSKKLKDINLTDWAGKLEDIQDDGLYCVRGVVRFANLVGIFEEMEGKRELTGQKSLIDGDNVNLRLTMDSIETAGQGRGAYQGTVKVLDRGSLAHLLDTVTPEGDPDLDWLLEMEPDAAIQEVADCCVGFEVIVFGRGSRVLKDRKGNVTTELDRPFMDIGRVGFIQVVGE